LSGIHKAIGEDMDIPQVLAELVDGRSIWFLSAHPDDAAYSSAGLLHILARSGRRVELIFAFSRSGYTTGEYLGDVETVTKIRKKETTAFLRFIQASWDPIWLDLDDAPLRPEYSEFSTCSTRPLRPHDLAIASEIASRIEALSTDAGVLFAPLGVGRHVDHRILRLAAMAVAADPNYQLVFYEDLPYAGEYRITDLDKSIGTFARAYGIDVHPIVISSQDLVALKRKAIACSPSQEERQEVDSALMYTARVSTLGAPAERLWRAVQHCDSAKTPLC
jgi:LmbE family N-acetylglucosaminyl deacetylase